jgi:hypothetical protein
MKSLRRQWRKFLISILKVYRAFDLGFSAVQNKKSKQDRLIIKVISGLLNSPGTKVIFLPKNGSMVYIHASDNKYLATVTRYQVRITNHKFFFVSNITDQMAESLINLAVIKLEGDVKELEAGMVSNEENFLTDIYEGFKQKNTSPILQKDSNQSDFLDSVI